MTMNEFLAQLSIALIPVIATGITALIGVGIAYLSGAVKHQFGEAAQDKADVYLDRMDEAAAGAVVAVQQSMVDRLKASGQWNEETATQVKDAAVGIGLAALGNLKDEIAKQLLIDVPSHMGILVELALKALKDKQSA